MIKNWKKVLTENERQRIFESDNNEILLSINKRERINTFENIIPDGQLSSVEQLLLAPYYIFNPEGFANNIPNIKDYGMDKLTRYAVLFNSVRYLYENNILRLISLTAPKKQSLELFSNQIKDDIQISKFIKNAYLTPHSDFTNLTFKEMTSQSYVAKMKRKTYLLNKNSIKKIELNEQEKERDLIHYFKTCFPNNFGLEPNKLVFNEELLSNYVIRFLFTLYDNVYVVVDNNINRVLYIYGIGCSNNPKSPIF